MLTKILKTIKRNFTTHQKHLKPTSYTDPSHLISDFFTSSNTNSNILLIRHAQSYGNLRNQLYGFTNYKLTPFGIEQSKAIKPHFSYIKKNFDSINSSNLIRAIQTANIVLGLDFDLGINIDDLEIFYEEKIRKVKNGKIEGEEGEVGGFKDFLGNWGNADLKGLDDFGEVVKRDWRFNEFGFGPMEGSDIVDMSHQEHYDLFRQ